MVTAREKCEDCIHKEVCYKKDKRVAVMDAVKRAKLNDVDKVEAVAQRYNLQVEIGCCDFGSIKLMR